MNLAETRIELSGPAEAHYQAFRLSCAQAGFDLVQPLRVHWYNEKVAGDLRLDDLGNGGHLGYVVGNTRALWTRFLGAWRHDPQLQHSAHPLDAYSEQTIGSALQSLKIPHSVRWAHEGGVRTVAMQRLAEIAGLAHTSPSYLSIHPRVGPWLGLRAAIVVALPGPTGRRAVMTSPCEACATGCQPALQKALEVSRSGCGSRLDRAAVEAHFPYWLRCRDACPLGKVFRYSDSQIRYHYLKDRSVLMSPQEQP